VKVAVLEVVDDRLVEEERDAVLEREGVKDEVTEYVPLRLGLMVFVAERDGEPVRVPLMVTVAETLTVGDGDGGRDEEAVREADGVKEDVAVADAENVELVVSDTVRE
jgi:hypothetical protein